ncbi:putative Ig domain-containing protein [Pseudomonas sp. GZD-209]|uniref:putative Ig domain-containing protein n=1 Tax=Pseudomonas sp. GZD-209 TaxID=3404807 RepID=UPI003BB54A23
MNIKLPYLRPWLARTLLPLLWLAQALTALAYAAPTISPAGGTLPDATVGVPYSFQLNAVGGTGSYTGWYECDNNDPSYDPAVKCLPAGLEVAESVDSAVTTISGTPTTATTKTFYVSVWDSDWNAAGTAQFTLTVKPAAATPTLSSVTPNNGSTAGGTAVTLSGTNLTGATAVKFAGTSAASFTVNSSTSITATTPANGAGTVNVSVTTSGGTATLTNAFTYTTPAAPIASAVSATLAANSSANPITLALSGGAATSVAVASAAAHGTATASGTSITYTPVAGYSGADSFTYTATNATGTSAPATVSVTVSPPILAITPTSLPAATAGNAYNQTLSSSNGTAPYTYALSSGALPPSMTLSGAGVLSGSPSANGNFSFDIRSTDQYGATGTRSYTVNVAAPTISVAPVSLSNGSYGVPYSQSISASGGSAPYSYAVSAGSLPSGMTLSPSGLVTGTPSATGTYNFTLTATDANTFSGQRAYTLVIAAPTLSLSPASLPVGNAGSSYSQTFATSGGIAPYSYTLSSGALPSGLSLSSSGTLSGVPTVSGSFNFTVQSSDANSQVATRSYTLTIGAPTVSITPPNLNALTQDVAYSQTLTASGGTAPYSFAVTSGAVPSGLSLSASGVLSGTPTSAGPYSFTVTATDSLAFSASQPYSGSVNAPTPVAGNLNLTVMANSSANPVTLNLSGGPATSVSVATNANNGVASAAGTSITFTPAPGFAGSDSFTYTATGPGGTSSPGTVTVTVQAPTVTLTPASLIGATVGTAYSTTISASGGSAPYSYSLSNGSLPNGLALSPGGSLTGTPSAAGSFTFTVQAADNTGFTGDRTYTLTVASQTPIAGAVSATVAANSTANPITLSLSGGAAISVAVGTGPSHGTALVSGLTISYTPTPGYSGSDSFTYTATGIGGTSAPATVTLSVSAPTLAISPATPGLGDATQGVPYSASLATTGGTAPYSYSLGSGSLPAGLTLDGATGIISGTATTLATSTFTITVSDALGASGSRSYNLQVLAQAIVVPPSSETLVAGQSASVDLTRGASGGPFLRARLLTVTPASAGKASMSGPFTLRFVPSAAFAGTAVVTFSLQNTGGSLASSSVTFSVQARPDPTRDPEVIGLLNAQSRAAERFATTQMDNFNRRLEQLHRPTCDRDSFNASVRHGRDDVSLGSLGKALRDELEGNGQDNDDEQRRQEKDSARASSGECREEALAFWTDGFVNTGSNRARGADDNSFTTYGLSAGMDYRLSPRAVVGFGIGYGNDRTDVGEHDSRSEGDALGLAAYLSVNPLSEVYIDALLGYNRIRFDARRYVTADPSNGYAHGSRDADQLFASLTASYEYRHGPLSLAPYARINGSYTRLDAYSERGGGVYGLSYEEQDLRYVTSFLGLRSGYDIQTNVGVLTPRVSLAWGHNFSRNEDYRMRYTDQGSDGLLYRLSPDPQDSNFMDLDLGLDLSLGRAWRVGLSYKTALGSDERSEMFRIGLDGRF